MNESRKTARTNATGYWKWKTEIENAWTDSRRLWRSVNTLYWVFSEQKNAGGPSFTSEIFRDFVDKKIDDIRSSTAAAPDPTFTRFDAASLCAFDTVSCIWHCTSCFSVVPNQTIALGSNATQHLLLFFFSGKHHTTQHGSLKWAVVAHHITNIVNVSLFTGIFTHSWKHVIVTLLLKKAGLDNTTRSNCCLVFKKYFFLSKVLERVVVGLHQQLRFCKSTIYFQRFSLLPESFILIRWHSWNLEVSGRFSPTLQLLTHTSFFLWSQRRVCMMIGYRWP